MNTTHRPYSEVSGDFLRLSRFLQENYAASRRYSTWCIGRLVDWRYSIYDNKIGVPDFWDRNAGLWYDAFDNMAGFAISENGDSGFAIITAEGYRFLFEEMLHWALETWRERGPRFAIEITEHQELEARALERCGFVKKSTFFTRRFDLTGALVPRFPLEEGFTIVDMQACPNYREQRILRANAFQGIQDDEETITRQMKYYNYKHQGPIYHAPADLCVMSPEGRFVSGCEALIDARNAEADIEVVCTHSAYRKRGFARAVIQECLYRLKEMGMRAAYITGYSPEAIALYGSLGAKEEMKAYVYEIPNP